MVNLINNAFKSNFKENLSNITLNTYFIFYRYFNFNYNISFLKFTELLHILKKFNLTEYNLFLSLFIYLFKFNKIQNLNVKFHTSLRNNFVFYFFNNSSIFIKRVLLSFKKNLTSLPNKSYNTSFLIRYSPTNVAKYLHNNYLSTLNVLFLRKNKVFNKGRYSRNRQFYRTGVYWCLYINIIAIVGLYFWFYRFVINFGYLWWLLFLSLSSFIVAKSFNYNLVTLKGLFNSIRSDLEFFSLLIHNIYSYLLNIFVSTFKIFNQPNLDNVKILVNCYIKKLSWFFFGFLNFFKINPFIYLWSYNNENYYIYSITLNFNRVFLDSKKNKFFSEFLNMLLK